MAPTNTTPQPLAWSSTSPCPDIPTISSVDSRLWIQTFMLTMTVNAMMNRQQRDVNKVLWSTSKFVLIPFITTMVAKSLYKTWGKLVAKKHAAPQTQMDYIMQAPKRPERVAVIGMGISGIQCMKTCLAEGIEPVGFDLDEDIGGFWRYKQDQDKPSVYESTHIDTDRDLAGYADFPWHPKAPLTIHNSIMVQYMRENVSILRMERFIRFSTKVLSITPHEKVNNRWTWKIVSQSNASQQVTEEIFDGVMICTGRHAGGAWVPDFPGLRTTFQRSWLHSSQYKSPQAHGIDSTKTVVVVGIGNSGLDVVTEVSPVAKKTILVSRSGAWITKLPYGDRAFSKAVGDRLTMGAFLSLPWFLQTELFELRGFFFVSDMVKDQAVLNAHGLKPAHRMWQQHPLMTGLNGHATIHEELEQGRIEVKKGIASFTNNGVVFVGEKEPVEVDMVIFATGYKQQCSALDARIVDMSFARAGNDVMLYKGIFPCNEYGSSLGFCNLIQSITFFASDLQSRAFFEVFTGRKQLPSGEERMREVLDTRKTLCAQFIDRSQLRVQTGASYLYYEDLAEFIGCRPTLGRILRERPNAIWHAFFCTWCPLQYRLVGPGRFEIAEQWIEERMATRFYGPYPEGSPFMGGQPKLEPDDRGGLAGMFNRLLGYASVHGLLLFAYLKGYAIGGPIHKHLAQNVKYAEVDEKERGIPHQLEFGGEPKVDVTTNSVVNRLSVWGAR